MSDAGGAFGQRGLGADQQPAAATGLGPDKTGGSGPVRNIIKRLRTKLGDDANNPTYIFNEPRVGYSMAKGESSQQATE